ncbi:hypothetical protein KR546_11430, partial [Nitriliruptoria bacterium AS10]
MSQNDDAATRGDGPADVRSRADERATGDWLAPDRRSDRDRTGRLTTDPARTGSLDEGRMSAGPPTASPTPGSTTPRG